MHARVRLGGGERVFYAILSFFYGPPLGLFAAGLTLAVALDWLPASIPRNAVSLNCSTSETSAWPKAVRHAAQSDPVFRSEVLSGITFGKRFGNGLFARGDLGNTRQINQNDDFPESSQIRLDALPADP